MYMDHRYLVEGLGIEIGILHRRNRQMGIEIEMDRGIGGIGI